MIDDVDAVELFGTQPLAPLTKKPPIETFLYRQYTCLEEGTPWRVNQVILHMQEILSHFPDARLVVAGGALLSLFRGETPVDYDLFPRTSPDHVAAKHVIQTTLHGRLLRATKWAELWATDIGRLDLITTPFETPIHVLDDFDFTICQAAVDDRETFWCASEYWEHVAQRVLVLHNIETPLATLRRIGKFTPRGFAMPKSELRRLIYAIRAISAEALEAQMDADLYRFEPR
jgi:hypothetical protein